MNHFRSLEVHKRSTEIRRQIWQLVKSFPSEEKFRLIDQIVRSTRKCPSQLAEGHGRYHWQENIQYCRIARASLNETQNHLDTALECEYISQEVWQQLDVYIETTIKMVNGYIRFLQKKLNDNKTS